MTTIRKRIEEIRRENTPALSRIESLCGFDLDSIGAHHDLPRVVGEVDWVYRMRIKTKLGLT